MKIRVFISRDAADCQKIQAFLPENIELVAASLIETQALPFDEDIPLTDWIFFSSSNAVKYFFHQNPRLSSQKIGAIGSATAESIKKYCKVDFTGDAMDITDSAYRFADIIGSQTVLFPSASDSLKHVQSALPAQQVIDLPVYSTHEKNVDLPECQLYVFSSPSNVRSFFKFNKQLIPQNTVCIAFGKSTEQELNRFGVTHVLIPDSLEPNSIAHTIIHAMHG